MEKVDLLILENRFRERAHQVLIIRRRYIAILFLSASSALSSAYFLYLHDPPSTVIFY
jgi:hypothetical protein